jgi:hypothetical protein
MSNLRCLEKSELRMLDPRVVRLSRDDFGRLKLELGFEERYEPVRVVRSLPLTDSERYISFQDEEGEEIGMLEEIRALGRESQRLLREELEMVYLKAEVQAIRKVDPRQGLISWDLDTSLGPRTIYIKDRSDIRPLPDGRIILTDVHGAKYQIPPIDQLDDRSRAWLEIEM